MSATQEVVSFQSGNLTLRGVLYRPEGLGAFPAVLYNHGSAPGMLNDRAFDELGPLFKSHGWVFFAPYRRGQGLSATAGPFIGDEIAAARNENAPGKCYSSAKIKRSGVVFLRLRSALNYSVRA